MSIKTLWLPAFAMLGAPLALSSPRAADANPIDEGKAVVTLAFPAGKEATITVHGAKKTDAYLLYSTPTANRSPRTTAPAPTAR